MLYGRYISVRNIIAKVYRDFGLKEEDDFVNFLEWSAEALEHIGVFEQLETRSICLQLYMYKAELPCDLVSVISVDCEGYNLVPTSNVLGPMSIPKNNPGEDTGLSTQINIEKIENAVFVGEAPHSGKWANTYNISNGYIKTGLKDAKINLIYKGVLLDEEGYPMIPDEVSFREAVYRYIVYKYLYPQWIKGQVTDRAYEDAKDMWYRYCNQAGSKAQMPDGPTLEAIKRSYLSLKPKVNQFTTFFEYLNRQ